LKPFAKVDPEFYTESKSALWDKEIKRIKSEKTIFSNKNSFKKLNDSSSKFFYQSKVFDRPQSVVSLNGKKNVIILKSTKNVEVNLDQPLYQGKRKGVSQRDRDFHTNICVTNPNKSQKVEIKEVRTKTISPMHLKLYESSMMKNTQAQKTAIPKSHPSYNKDPPKAIIPTSTKKRIENNKTTYNFMKNYY